MKKKSKNNGSVIIVLLCLSLFLYFFFPKPPCSIIDFDKRAVWISYQELSELDYHSKQSFRKDFETILNEVIKYKTNTIIVHVRAFSDALYQSSLFPLSQIMTNQTQLSFDPLVEMVDLAHEKGLYFEAWVNPYRISLNERTYNQFMNSIHRSWLNNESLTIHYGTYQYILNPASQKVRDYIVDGIKEIVSNYEVDGIHFDDYFYVSNTFGKTTQEERLKNVNLLIKDVYQSIKAINNQVTFGISPQGNYENCINQGADVDTWLKESGYIDYLMPQIYWSNQYGKKGKTKLFTQRAKLFASLKRCNDVQLYAGLALYHSGEELSDDQGWFLSSSNISDQVQILSRYGYNGYSLFKYSSLKKESAKKEMNELLRVHS